MSRKTEDVTSELEKEFLAAKEQAEKEINEKLEVASKALTEAEQISEKYGVPFYSNVSFLSQTYTPNSFSEKFGELDKDWLWEIADSYYPDDDYPGWQHSAVC